MNDRIKAMADRVMTCDIYPPITPTEYDPSDMFLPECRMNAKRLYEYLDNQIADVSDSELLVGRMKYDDSVTSEYYARRGHKHFQELSKYYYIKPQQKLCYMEWIHSGADLEYVLNHGFEGYYNKIGLAKVQHADNPDQLDFLESLKTLADGLMNWTRKCSQACLKKSAQTGDLTRRHQLLEMTRICERVPFKPASSFYEAVQTAFFVFSFVPDSPGRLDQYLYPLYRKDIESRRITKEFAFELIQEYLIKVFGHQGYQNHRSGDNHFCVGGYRPDGKDGYNELSALIMEAFADLPIWRPQISFRWTRQTTMETMKYVTALNKRCMNIVFVNDEPRVQAYMNLGIPFEDAVNYTTVGCNETQVQGKGEFSGGMNANIGRSMANMLHEHADEVCALDNFESFYQSYETYLHQDLDGIMDYCDKFARKKSKDVSLIASLLNEGCIEKANWITNGGGKYHIASITLDGVISNGDSLSVVRQFVYDEKKITLQELIAALKDNWEGHEELRAQILREGRFYGNDDDYVDLLTKRIVDSIYAYTKDRRTTFGGHFQFGSIVGYNPSNIYFGALLPATPDGRYDGDPFCIGMSQIDDKDQTGLTALMKSVAKIDYSKFGGPIVLNIKADKRLVANAEQLEKMANLYYTYFSLGGMQLQPNYLSTEELLKAQQQPEQYKNLRVRVSGFSGYFTLLSKDLQEDVIRRTDHANA